MNINDKNLINKSIRTEKELMRFFSDIPLPDGITGRYLEEEECIEFGRGKAVYAAMIGGNAWEKQKEKDKGFQVLQAQGSGKRDSLTKLYNKEYSRSIIEEFLAVGNKETHHAFMIVDIDNFNVVNESLGYLFGDTVLLNIADSLSNIFHDGDITARIGEDEFLIFLKNVSDREIVRKHAEKISAVLHQTYTGENKDYSMSCSIGAAVYPDDGEDYLSLFANADMALQYIRKSEHSHFGFCCDIRSAYPEGWEKSAGDSYESYRIRETRAYGTSNFDKEITAFAFDIMSRTRDVNSAINLLLNRMRLQFDCSHICIIENTVAEPGFRITYMNSRDAMEVPGSLNGNEYIDVSDYADKFDDNGLYYVCDTGFIKQETESPGKDTVGLKAVIQCAIYENGIFKGCVSVDDCEKARYWTQGEIDSLVTITKIISSYLLKMRASERANKELYKIRNYDALTGLPTLHKFKKDVRNLLAEYPDRVFAIIYSDISQFKNINDTLGYDIGDSILCDFADYLTLHEKYHLGLARCSEDNFVALIEYLDADELKKHILHINEQFNGWEKLKYPANHFVITSGVSVIDPGKDISIAIDNANIARKSVKDTLKTVCRFFDHSMEAKLQKETEITNNMEQALKDGEFIVYLQPKIELKGNTLVGAEALVRWKKEGNMLIPPNDFIPLFEKNGFVVFLDFYVYEEVCRKLRKWLDEGLPVVPISLNVSRIHLNDENFVNDIEKLVDSYRIPHSLLELELTESIFLNNTEEALTVMRKLRKKGFDVSIDDFGAGYSSLNLLKDMATDVIKLDKEFFGQGEMQKEEQIIVSSIISMAKQLNMKVLSEGVETKKQSDFLKSVCCDMAQGFLYSKPMPVPEFEKAMVSFNSSI